MFLVIIIFDYNWKNISGLMNMKSIHIHLSLTVLRIFAFKSYIGVVSPSHLRFYFQYSSAKRIWNMFCNEKNKCSTDRVHVDNFWRSWVFVFFVWVADHTLKKIFWFFSLVILEWFYCTNIVSLRTFSCIKKGYTENANRIRHDTHTVPSELLTSFI